MTSSKRSWLAVSQESTSPPLWKLYRPARQSAWSSREVSQDRPGHQYPRPCCIRCPHSWAWMIAETSGLEKYPDSELEAIGFVGVNRAVDSGRSIVEVMGPDARSNQGVWNNSQAFRSRWNDAPTFPKWPRAERIARRVLSGEIADPIDGRTLFAHISGLPRPVNGSCGPRRYLSKDSRGRDRCAPNWLKNDPVTIGAATFARGDRS